MKQKLLSLSLVIFLITTICLAQTKTQKQPSNVSETLTNSSIIDLAKAGLGNDMIIAKINHSKTNFDLSSSGLIALKNQKVDNGIIKAMMDKTDGVVTQNPTIIKAEQAKKSGTLDLTTVDMLNHVYSYDKTSGKVIPLEKNKATLVFKKKMMGMGGMSVMYTIKGAKSSLRLTPDQAGDFVINTADEVPDMILYKLEVTADGRQAITQKSKAMSTNLTPDDNMVTFNTSAVKTGVYQFTLSNKLQKGEYFFIKKPVESLTVVDAFVFGID